MAEHLDENGEPYFDTREEEQAWRNGEEDPYEHAYDFTQNDSIEPEEETEQESIRIKAW
jgi:hypothetical protein